MRFLDESKPYNTKRALKMEPKPTVFEKYTKLDKKNMLSLFSILCDFLYKFQAKFPKTK